MKRTRWSLLCVAAGALSLGGAGQPQPTDTGWRDLFNGRDLTGWASVMGNTAAWTTRDGEIVSAIPGQGEWLRTDKAFSDFELTLEIFLPVGANTGVGFRTAEVGDPAYAGYEIQINDSAGQEPTSSNAGAVFRIAPARVMAIHPGAWNRLRLRVVGATLDAWLNGERIHAGTRLPRRESDRVRPGGGRRGHIALQDNGGAARFRRVRIRPIGGAFTPPR